MKSKQDMLMHKGPHEAMKKCTVNEKARNGKNTSILQSQVLFLLLLCN
jgi:hypothetical protein